MSFGVSTAIIYKTSATAAKLFLSTIPNHVVNHQSTRLDAVFHALDWGCVILKRNTEPMLCGVESLRYDEKFWDQRLDALVSLSALG